MLHAPGLPRLNDGLGAVEALLEERSGPVRRADGSKATIQLRVSRTRAAAWP